MDDGGGGGGGAGDASNMYNSNFFSAYDPFKLADVLNSKTAAVVRGFEEASATPPSSVCAVEADTAIREALDELALSEVRAVPVRDKVTGVVLGFFDATQALAVALAAAGGTESERNVLEQPVSNLIDPRLDAGRRGDGGTLPFACADLPLRKGAEDPGGPKEGEGILISSDEMRRGTEQKKNDKLVFCIFLSLRFLIFLTCAWSCHVLPTTQRRA